MAGLICFFLLVNIIPIIKNMIFYCFLILKFLHVLINKYLWSCFPSVFTRMTKKSNKEMLDMATKEWAKELEKIDVLV